MTAADDEMDRAAEYVLGTLDAQERREVERALASDAELRAAVHAWERRLAPLAEAVPPVAPRPGVWEALRARLSDGRIAVLQRRARRATAWALLATAASLAMVALLVLAPAPEPELRIVRQPVVQATYLAYLKMPDVDMHWTVSIVPEAGRVTVAAGGTPPDAAAELDTELWWLGPRGPVSMGVIPKRGSRAASIPGTVGEFEDRQLAVSLEPQGGSPTGQPTGPVIAVAEIVRAI